MLELIDNSVSSTNLGRSLRRGNHNLLTELRLIQAFVRRKPTDQK